jgi:hypothetical protein
LIPVLDGADEDGLEHSVLPERVGQGGDLGRIEVPARLEWVRIDLIHGDPDQIGRFDRAGFVPPLAAPEQRFQATTETLLIHRRCPP